MLSCIDRSIQLKRIVCTRICNGKLFEMGVKELWSVLSPVHEKKSLWELKDKAIAVDLSAWICDSQNIGENSQRNMYLRNLFFRTSFLLLLGAKPIFVLEGAAPDLKLTTIIARSQARSGKENVPKSSSRSHLKSLQKQCEKLLATMGISCVQAPGEAEAYCAWLNEKGIVDAVITQDSDCFLYGAQTVYRNFTMSPSFTCEVYDMSVIEKKLKLGRTKLLAISLLCGCDYNKGVNGVGKESAVKFLSTLEDDEVLERLRSWTYNPMYDEMERMKPSTLTTEQKLEINIRKKALKNPDFPSDDIIEEYLSPKSANTNPLIGWLEPQLPSFLKIAHKQLGWDEQYIIEKFFPLITRWHLLHPILKSTVKLEAVIKKKVIRGIKCYECKWNANDLTLMEKDTIFITNEPQDLINEVYNSLAEEFIESKKKKTKKGTKTTTRKKKSDKEDNVLNNVESLLHNLSIEEKKTEKQPNKKRLKNKTIKGLQTLDKFLSNDVCSNNEPQSSSLKNDSFTSDPLSQSTPNRKFLKESTNDSFTNNENNISFHYNNHSLSPSPLKHKRINFLLDKEKNTSKSINVSDRWSITDYLPSTSTQENKNEINTLNSSPNRVTLRGKLDASMSESFFNISHDISEFNMSDIVNSIINTTNANPAVRLILGTKIDHNNN